MQTAIPTYRQTWRQWGLTGPSRPRTRRSTRVARRTHGNGPDGLYCYNFCLHNNVGDYQPCGAMNMSLFNKIQFEMRIIDPPMDMSAQVLVACDGSGNIVSVDKTRENIYDYTYDLTVLEERYNILTFSAGNAALSYAR